VNLVALSFAVPDEPWGMDVAWTRGAAEEPNPPRVSPDEAPAEP